MLSIVERINRVIMGALCLLMVIVGGAEVFMRYVLTLPLSWSQEISIYMSIWMIFLGSAYATRLDRHPSVDFAAMVMPTSMMKLYRVCRQLVAVIVAAVFVYYGIALFDIPTIKSSALHIPYTYIYLSLPVSMALSLLYALVNIYAIIVEKKI